MAPYVHLDFQHQPIERRQQSAYVKVSKKTIKVVRIGLIILRVLQLFGALGLLVCMLLVRKIDDTTGWICRAPVFYPFLDDAVDLAKKEFSRR